MSGVSAIIGVVGGFLGIVGVIASAVVIVRSKIAAVTIDLLNQNLAAQSTRIDTLQTENSALTSRVVALEATKDELFTQVKSLPEFERIAATLAEMQETMATQATLMARWVDELTTDRR